eukprot:2468702-Prymnesium_polylepis.1
MLVNHHHSTEVQAARPPAPPVLRDTIRLRSPVPLLSTACYGLRSLTAALTPSTGTHYLPRRASASMRVSRSAVCSSPRVSCSMSSSPLSSGGGSTGRTVPSASTFIAALPCCAVAPAAAAGCCCSAVTSGAAFVAPAAAAAATSSAAGS